MILIILLVAVVIAGFAGHRITAEQFSTGRMWIAALGPVWVGPLLLLAGFAATFAMDDPNAPILMMGPTILGMLVGPPIAIAWFIGGVVAICRDA